MLHAREVDFRAPLNCLDRRQCFAGARTTKCRRHPLCEPNTPRSERIRSKVEEPPSKDDYSDAVLPAVGLFCVKCSIQKVTL